MHFLVSNLVGPLDITEAVVMREIDLFHISFRFSPALRAILKDNLNIAVVKPDLIVLGLFRLDAQMLHLWIC